MITVGQWIHWECQRWELENETPGRFGYFGEASE